MLLAELAHDAAEAAALFTGLDLPRHADVIDRRHEDQEPSRHRHVRGEARALGAERLLDHLDEDVLALLQEVFDLGFGPITIVPEPAARGVDAPAGPPRSRPRRSGLPPGRRGDGGGLSRGRRWRDACFSAGSSRRPSGDSGRFGGAAAALIGGNGRLADDDLVVLVVAGEPFEFLDGADDFRDVEERVAFEADVNKGGLHAGENLVHPALVDVANTPR